jgi:hypothetical protein
LPTTSHPQRERSADRRERIVARAIRVVERFKLEVQPAREPNAPETEIYDYVNEPPTRPIRL